MTVHLLAALFAANVFADGSTFTTEADDIGEFFEIPASFGVDEDITVELPGSSETYDAVKYVHDRVWNVHTNGVLALTNETVNLVYTANGVVGGVYKLVYDLNPTVTSLGLDLASANRYQKWRPGIFDFATAATGATGEVVRIRFSSSGGGETCRGISTITGVPCFQPKAARLSPATVAGVLSSYDGYFERLYYASEGNVCDYADKWGPNEPGSEFRFNLTNDEYSADCYFDFAGVNVSTGGVRSIPDTRKIADRLDLIHFQTNVLVNLLSTEAVSTGAQKPVNPGFIYRPKGVLDASTPTNGSAFVWWASRDNPPKWKWEFDGGCWQDPENDGFGFFPTFGWMENPICDETNMQRYDWPTRCVTLNMATAEEPTHPARKLFELVCGEYTCELPLDDYVKPYRFGSTVTVSDPLVHWMTNVYPMAAQAYTDRAYSFDRYRQTSGAAVYGGGPLRRLHPNDYVGVNHVLAAMNRTIMIPNMRIVSTNEHSFFENTARYTHEVPVTFNFYPNGTWTIIGQTSGRVSMAKTSETNEVERSDYEYDDDGFYLDATAVNDEYSDTRLVAEALLGIPIDESFLGENGEEGENELVITGVSEYPSAHNYVEVYYILNGTNSSGYAYTQGTDVATNATISMTVRNSYHTYLPKTITPNIGPTQPGETGADLVKSAKCVNLSRIVINDDVKYRSEESSFTTRNGLVAATRNSIGNMAASLKGLVMAANGGYDYEIPTSYAPLSSSLMADYEIGTGGEVTWETWGKLPSGQKSIPRPYYLTFENATNIIDLLHKQIYHVTETHRTSYDSYVTVYCGGSIVSNCTETGSSVDPIVERIEDGGTTFMQVMTVTGTYKCGPFDAIPSSVDVPIYNISVTNDVLHVYYDTVSMGDYRVVTTWMSGSGPDDPGESVSNETRYVSIQLEKQTLDMGELPNGSTVSDPVFGYSISNPSSEATIEGGPVLATPSRTIYFSKNHSGNVSNVRVVYRYYDQVSGELLEEEEGSLPISVGGAIAKVEIGTFIYRYDQPEICDTEVEIYGNTKIMTQVDWKFKNLRKD